MTDPDANATKPELRAHYRGLRKGQGKVERAVKDREIRRHLLTSPRLRRCKHVAAYWATNGEPDLRELLERLLARGISVWLPVTSPGRVLAFHRWAPGVELRRGRLGIMEPAGTEALPVEKLDMALMPLVAWDRQGRRLGMGGGYYDRTFKRLLGLQAARRVGVAYALQECPRLPADAWDVPLHHVVTEEGWFTCTP